MLHNSSHIPAKIYDTSLVSPSIFSAAVRVMPVSGWIFLALWTYFDTKAPGVQVRAQDRMKA